MCKSWAKKLEAKPSLGGDCVLPWESQKWRCGPDILGPPKENQCREAASGLECFFLSPGLHCQGFFWLTTPTHPLDMREEVESIGRHGGKLKNGQHDKAYFIQGLNSETSVLLLYLASQALGDLEWWGCESGVASNGSQDAEGCPWWPPGFGVSICTCFLETNTAGDSLTCFIAWLRLREVAVLENVMNRAGALQSL